MLLHKEKIIVGLCVQQVERVHGLKRAVHIHVPFKLYAGMLMGKRARGFY
jgi:hypothetical protein